jgi:hypothetical protein
VFLVQLQKSLGVNVEKAKEIGEHFTDEMLEDMAFVIITAMRPSPERVN